MGTVDASAVDVVLVEVFGLSWDEEGLWVRPLTERLSGPVLGQVHRMVGHDGNPARVVHSTSWRQLPTGETVLTWVVVPDPEPFAGPRERFRPVREPSSGRLDVPAPPELPHAAVVGHALSHLCFLMRRDESAFYASWRLAPELWSLILVQEPERAGRLV
jgi:hypothetical protein